MKNLQQIYELKKAENILNRYKILDTATHTNINNSLKKYVDKTRRPNIRRVRQSRP